MIPVKGGFSTIYLDNAATTYPKPLAVQQAVNDAIRLYGGNPGRSGHFLSLRAGEQVFRVREQLAAFFGCEDNRVIFTKNCTEALNLAIQGCTSPGDHVLLSDLEHNSVYRPIVALAERGIISYDVVETSAQEEETVQRFRRKLQKNTRLICCTHASNVTGQILPIRAIGALAKEHGALFLVDAAQTAGLLPIDMNENHIDFLCTAGHKGLYGIGGTGVLALGKEAPLLNPLMQGGTGSASAEPNQPDFYPDRLESGTLSVPGIMSIGAGLLAVQQMGLSPLFLQEQRYCRKLYEMLSKLPNVTLYQPDYLTKDYAPIVLFNVKGRSSDDVLLMLSKQGICVRGGLHCAPLAHQKLGTMEEGAVRISPGMFLKYKDLQAVRQALVNVL